MGASTTTPYPIRHGPPELGGLNIIDLRTETGIARIKFLRSAIYGDSEAGRLLLLSIKSTQLEAGIEDNILSHPHIPLPYLTDTWITSLRQFLSKHFIRIDITDTLNIRYNGNRDMCIMNPTLLRGYTTQQQKDINLVRLYLQAITPLSDISTDDGSEIRLTAHTGDRTSTFHHRRAWPRQEPPTASQRRLWTKYIESNYLRYGKKWRQPLGPVVPSKHRSPPETSSGEAPHECNSLRQYLQSLPTWHRRLDDSLWFFNKWRPT